MRIKRSLIILSSVWIFFAAELERGFYSEDKSLTIKITNSAAYNSSSEFTAKSSEHRLNALAAAIILPSKAFSQGNIEGKYPGYATGFAVQAATISEESKALEIERYFQNILSIDAVIKYEDRGWKILAGSFKDKEHAEQLCERVRGEGYPGAFVVSIPLPIIVKGFRVQLSTHSAQKSADDFAQSISSTIGAKVYVIPDGKYWKIRAGDFKTKEDAVKLRDFLKNKGYDDAWIVADEIEP